MTEPAPIRVLSDAVINQIAAGEVVERPASVLKELVENSIDAGATWVEVDIVDGGRRLVRVRDDGTGMDRDNALLSLERHATSKLREFKDLDSIETMGFRGEALAAIASVSQFSLATQRNGSATGTEILVFGGKIQEVRDAGLPQGTEIAVRNLFFNVPARRKFLRTAQTEFTHVRQAFILEALANAGIGFVLRADDSDVYRLPPASNLLERIRDLYGDELASHLRPLRHGTGTVEIGGYAGVPPFCRMDREWQIFFINGRPTGSPVINFAVQNAYRSVLPAGKYAPLFLRIGLPAEMVDINVHPAKKEVRFRRPTEVRDVIAEAIRLAISGPDISVGKRIDSPSPASSPAISMDVASSAILPSPAPSYPSVAAPVAIVQRKLDLDANPYPEAVSAPSSGSPWGRYRLVGKIGGQYVVLETEDGMVLLDPKSAHERVIYERLIRSIESRKPSSQGILVPAAVTVSPGQANALGRYFDLLKSIGFGISEFGADTFMVDALPADLAAVDPLPLLSDLADGLMQGGKGGAKDWALPLVAAIAGRRAVDAQRELAERELHALIQDLACTEMPYTSPRGKPTVILFSFRELNRKFGKE